MELPALDLNLLVVLHALLEERNVTRAGEQVGLSQPATSAALARLRRHFDDLLLERVGTHYELTPVAQALRAELGDTVERLSRLLATQPRFDPASSTRRFTVQCSDSVLTALGPRLVAALHGAAPGTGVDFRPVDPALLRDPLTVLGDVDALIMVRGLLSGLPNRDAYTDRWVCVACADNKVTPDVLTEDDVRAARWVVPHTPSPMSSPADAHLAALGLQRTSTVTVHSFTALSRLVSGTELLALAHERTLAESAAVPLRRIGLPVPMPPLIQAVWWHPSRQLDPGHRWLLDLITDTAASLPPLPEDDAPLDAPGDAQTL
ncbi:LysR family transcriptional regulator [Streptomyces sp. NPDC004237]|uniref:LysR family transcriptional regulator n=1 Tax=Streptomyces sp. NPDC004237 TaxID=3154455 RepID=UPI0033A237A7